MHNHLAYITYNIITSLAINNFSRVYRSS